MVAATLRAVQLLARQFVLGQTIEDALGEARSQRRSEPHLRFSFDMLGEGARTMDDADRYFELPARHPHARAGARSGHGRRPRRHRRHLDQASALHPRYEDAQREAGTE